MLKSMGLFSEATTAVRLYGLVLSLWALITAVICGARVAQGQWGLGNAAVRSGRHCCMRPTLPAAPPRTHHVARRKLLRGVVREVDGRG
jgi:hypothetical protein